MAPLQCLRPWEGGEDCKSAMPWTCCTFLHQEMPHLSLCRGREDGAGEHIRGGPRKEAVAVHAIGDQQRGAPELLRQNGLHGVRHASQRHRQVQHTVEELVLSQVVVRYLCKGRWVASALGFMTHDQSPAMECRPCLAPRSGHPRVLLRESSPCDYLAKL